MEKHVELGGKAYVLKYTTNSAAEVEERSGKPFVDLFTSKMKDIRYILWGALIEKQPETTIKDVGAIMDACYAEGMILQSISELCAEVVTSAGFFGKAAPKK